MRRRTILLALLVPFVLAGCNDKQAAKIPPPHRMTAEDIGHYCGMNVLEHPGPKGHIFVASLMEPVWFSSVRDTIAFTMLPDEPKDIQAIVTKHVNDAAVKERADTEKLNATVKNDLASKGLVFNQPDPGPFRDKLRAAGFYNEWKKTYGEQAWALLEKAVGKLS